MLDQSVRVQMCNISKHFGGVRALKSVDLSVKKGEIHAICGENGAGKSTLMKILSGAYSKDAGCIYIDGREVEISNPKVGIELGVSVIYQEFALVNDLTVAENIFIDNLNEGHALIHWKALISEANKILSELGFGQIKAKRIVSELSVAYQQVVEICKALSRKSSILILDEPTAVLSSTESEQLFTLLNKLREDGVAIIYISHRMEEITKICDRVTVLKDGEFVATMNVADSSAAEIVNMMIGRDLKAYFPVRESNIGDVVFEAKNIKRGKIVNDISFKVRAGEVFGLTGLVGSGRTETVRVIFGADKSQGGEVFIDGKKLNIKDPASAVKAGIALLPEDRKNQGVLLELPILFNISLCKLKKFCRAFGIIKRKDEIDFVNSMVNKLVIKIGSINDEAQTLSGGNQQKVAMAKLLGAESKVLILDEPTRGVDVGAKIEIYKIINSLVAEGYAVIMISSEMSEVIGMCDRVAVMRNGQIMGELQKNEICEQNLIKLSMGVN